MAKKGLLGKIVAALVAGAAIGSACYIFRDKIRESALYTKLDVDKRLAQLKAFFKKEEDDFFEEDEYLFHDTSSSDRTYVSLDTGSQEASEEDSDAEEAATDNISDSSDAEEDIVHIEETVSSSDEVSDSAEEPEETSNKIESIQDFLQRDASLTEDALTEDTSFEEDIPAEEDATAEDDLTEEEFDTTPVQENSVPTITIETIGDIYDAANRKAAASAFTADDSDDTPTGYDMEGLSDVSEDPEVLIEQDMLDEASFGY